MDHGQAQPVGVEVQGSLRLAVADLRVEHTLCVGEPGWPARLLRRARGEVDAEQGDALRNQPVGDAVCLEGEGGFRIQAARRGGRAGQQEQGGAAVALLQPRHEIDQVQAVLVQPRAHGIFQRGTVDQGPAGLGEHARRHGPAEQAPELIAHDAPHGAHQRGKLALGHARVGRLQQRGRNGSAAQQGVDVAAKAARALHDLVQLQHGNGVSGWRRAGIRARRFLAAREYRSRRAGIERHRHR